MSGDGDCEDVTSLESSHKISKKDMITYSREFLLSLSELKVCKELPTGVNRSIISELTETSSNIAERPRLPGSFSSQNFRRNDYGSSPPTRGDSGSYIRGGYGKWDTRSSGSNDRDVDSQSDLDSDSGKVSGGQSRRSKENEHDGLLGSGVLPRPSGHSTGVSALKVGGSSQFQLSRTDAPYQPPRPYKAIPQSRRDTDAFNDETFGSSECSNQDREEEERKRRASFELFRKDNVKSLQEKPKQSSYSNKEKFDPDIAALLANTEDDKKLLEKNIRLENIVEVASQSVPAKCLPQAPTSRPLVPPGFANTIPEKNFGSKTSNVNSAPEVASVEYKGKNTAVKVNFVENGISGNLEKKIFETTGNTFTNVSEDMTIPFSGLEAGTSVGIVNPSYMSSSLSKAYEGKGGNTITALDAEIGRGHNIVATSGQTQSSMLTKLFGPTLTMPSASSSYIEHSDVSEDNTMTNSSLQSSKFARWFPHEEYKLAEDLSSGKPKDLLSLISSGGEGFQLSKVSKEGSEQFPVVFSDTTEQTPGVLTCEDLEQSILSEIHDPVPTSKDPFQAWSVWEHKHDQSTTRAGDGASHHLLSMLQKGTGEENAPQIHNSENNLTLESLFGTNFMKELHSAEAPLSVQRGSFGGPGRADGLGAQDFSNPNRTDGFFLPRFKENESNRTALEGGAFETHFDATGKSWSGFQAPNTEVVSNMREDRTEEIQLPEEDNLITIGDHVKPPNSNFISRGNELSTSREPSGNIVDKLAELNAALKSERSIGSGLNGQSFLGSLESDILYQNLHGRGSSQFNNPQMNNEMQLLQRLDTYHAQMSYRTPMGQGRAIHHDQLPGNSFLPSFQHPHGPTRFEPPSHHHSMLQHMQMRDNFPPPQFLPRGASPPHHINHMAGFRPEMNPLHGFPPNHCEQVHGGPGMPMAALVGGGSSHPDSLERLIAMEMRANAKQMHPAPQNPGTYSHESDMGFRYR